MPDQPARRGRPGHDQGTVQRRAVELFNSRGYDATSMSDLARDLGVSKSSLYHHVSGKEDLLAAALDEALDNLSAAIDAAAALTGTPLDRLRLAVEGSVRVLVEHLPAVTLLLRVHGNSVVELAALERRRGLDDRLSVLVRAAADDGALRGDVPPAITSRLLFGMVNSLVEWYRPGGSVDVDVLAHAVADLAFGGLER